MLAGGLLVAGVFVWLILPRPESSYESPRRGVDTYYDWPVVSRTIIVQPEDLDRERPP